MLHALLIGNLIDIQGVPYVHGHKGTTIFSGSKEDDLTQMLVTKSVWRLYY